MENKQGIAENFPGELLPGGGTIVWPDLPPPPEPQRSTPVTVMPAPVQQNKSYELSAEERAAFSTFNLSALNAKAKLYDLTVQIEQAKAEYASAQASFTGAVTVLARHHGMSESAALSQDFTHLVGR